MCLLGSCLQLGHVVWKPHPVVGPACCEGLSVCDDALSSLHVGGLISAFQTAVLQDHPLETSIEFTELIFRVRATNEALDVAIRLLQHIHMPTAQSVCLTLDGVFIGGLFARYSAQSLDLQPITLPLINLHTFPALDRLEILFENVIAVTGMEHLEHRCEELCLKRMITVDIRSEKTAAFID